MRTQSDNIKVATSLFPQDGTGAAKTGAGVDRAGFAETTVVVSAGVITGDVVNFKVQDSDDGATGWADVVGGDISQFGAADDDNTKLLEIKATEAKRFIRVVATAGGAATAAQVSAHVLLGRPRRGPVDQDNPVETIG